VRGNACEIFAKVSPSEYGEYGFVDIYIDGTLDYTYGDENLDQVVYRYHSFPLGEHTIKIDYRLHQLPLGSYPGRIIDVQEFKVTATKDGLVYQNTAEIPEFPSVALPVMAVIGLLVIVGRKKV
jgi:hypothetical protein